MSVKTDKVKQFWLTLGSTFFLKTCSIYSVKNGLGLNFLKKLSVWTEINSDGLGLKNFLVRNLKELLGGKLSFIKLLRIYAVAKLPDFIKKPLVIIKNKIKMVFKKIKTN